jgi:hypothetical protein
MGRLVRSNSIPRPHDTYDYRGPAPRRADGSSDQPDPAPYLERVIKYIPSEIVALYLAVLPFVNLAPGTEKGRLLWFVYGICQILTAAYLWKSVKNAPKKPVQVALGTIAFFCWAYALGGPFENAGLYKPYYSGPLLVFTTFFFGKYNPK